jgi:hypothetical protein
VTPPARFAAAFALCFCTLPATADDAPFLGTDPASVMAEGDRAVQQWLSWGTGQAGQSYNAFESLTEFDYGLTDRIQLALTLAYDWDRTRPPGGPAATSSLVGLQGELVYILAATDQSPVGIALAIDPAFNSAARSFAFRILLTKYFWGLENVLNINFENVWEKDGSGGWQESGAVVFNYGLGYGLGQHWTVALELGNQLTFNRLVTAANFKDSGTTLYLGPTVEYDSSLAVVSVGVQMQLPVASGQNVVNGYMADAERWRAGLRVARSI